MAADQVFNALGDPTRRALVERLSRGPMSVSTFRLELKGLDVAASWLAERRTLWERRFDRLGDLLAEDGAAETPKRRAKKRQTSRVRRSKS
jgi:DNA-binding transcriptional ArsR family regulator